MLHTDRDTGGHVTLTLIPKVIEQSGFERCVQHREDFMALTQAAGAC